MISTSRTVSLFVIVAILYLLLVIPRAVRMLASGPGPAILGVALVAVPIVTGVVLVRQLRRDMVRRILSNEYRSEGHTLDEVFDRARSQADVDAQPNDWRAWTRLALACEADRDRKAARVAWQQALRRHGPWDVSSSEG